MLKKFICLFLSIAATLSLIGVCGTFQVAAAEDSTPPELVAFEILNTEITAGESVQVKIWVRESETGLSRVLLQINHVEEYANGVNPIQVIDSLSTPLYSSGDTLIEHTITLYTPVNTHSGDWIIGYLELYDQKENFSRYCGHKQEANLFQEFPTKDAVLEGATHIQVSSSADPTRPHINSISIKNPVVEKPGVLQVEMDVTSSSPISYAQVDFVADNYSDTFVHFVNDMTRVGETGLIFEIPIEQSRHLGEWRINALRLYDANGVCGYYQESNGTFSDFYDSTDVHNLQTFTVTGEKGDETKPILNGITVLNDNKTVEKPGILKIEVDITEEESGVTGFEVYYERTDGADIDFGSRTSYFIYAEGYDRHHMANASFPEPLKTGKHTLEIPIFSTKHSGEYVVKIRMLEDAYQNQVNDYIGEGPSAAFTVSDEFNYVFEYGITNQGLLSAIQSLQEGEVGRILLSDKREDNILTKEMLDAIAGQKKTLVCYKDGYQWIFEGKKINANKTKDLNLTMRVVMISGDNLSSGKDAVCLSFENNGNLPGPVQFRFKTAFVKEFFGREELLHMFHVDAPESGYETDIDYANSDYTEIAHKDVNFKVIMEEKDAWCYVNLHHNSKYIVSDAKIVKYVNPDNVPQDTTPSTQPTVPTVPETEPTVPETEPTVPETEPTVPETEPTVLETEPTVPETEPTVPETEPTVPETEPTVPETEPETTPPTTGATVPATEATQPTTPENPSEPADSGSVVIWIVLAVVILSGLAVGGFYAYKKDVLQCLKKYLKK